MSGLCTTTLEPWRNQPSLYACNVVYVLAYFGFEGWEVWCVSKNVASDIAVCANECWPRELRQLVVLFSEANPDRRETELSVVEAFGDRQ